MDASAIASYLKAGSIAGRARDYGATLVVEGAKLIDVAEAVEAFVRKEGGEPAFPCCISRNEDAAHYTPSVADTATFAKGDLVKLDCGVQVDGYIGDTAVTIEVGTETRRAHREAAKAAWEAAAALVKDGLPVRDIGAAVEATIQGYGLRPIVNLTGHSVDRYHQHAGVSIPNVPVGRGELAAPIAVAIEPFATDGQGRVRDGGPGHIFHYRGQRPVRDPIARKALDYIREHHEKLPFAERWIAPAVGEAKVPYAMKILERAGALHQYPILREAGGGWVAQHEHTFLVLADKVHVTTRT